jgi:hypothetical protein
MTDLKIIIDSMLPGDPILGMPCASKIDFDTYLLKHGLSNLSINFVQMLDKICEEKIGVAFSQLDEMQKIQSINACKLVDIRLFSAMVNHLLKAYYTSPSVLSKISSGSVPPFPTGNSLEPDEWSILEHVYERGQVFREISQASIES